MTGTILTASFEDRATAGLKALAEQDGGIARAALKNIGELLVRRTRARIEAAQAPDGRPWAPLNPAYAAGKRGPGSLRESGQLAMSVVWQLDGDTLEIGTNKIYGAIHQLGGRIVPRTARALAFRLGGRVIMAKAVTIPARPYIGLSAADADAILGVIADHAEMIADNAR